MSATRLPVARLQRGAALVESAITLSVFLLVIIGIIEFSLLMFTWARGAEAARSAVRTAIVSAPLLDLSSLTCLGGGATELATNCDGVAACDPVYDNAQSFLPSLARDQLVISYRCSTTGQPGRPEDIFIPEVTAELVGVNYRMILPRFIGLDGDWSLPAMTSTRTGESLQTITAP